MNLREELLKEHSKTQSHKIAFWAASDKSRINDLISLFLTDEYRVVQRAAWPISVIAEHNPLLILPYLDQLIRSATKSKAPIAVKRNVIRLLQFVEIPEQFQGDIMNLCFDFLANPNEAIAVRCFSMTVLYNLSKYYTDIKGELRAIIEDILEHSPTPALKARGRQVLASISKNK